MACLLQRFPGALQKQTLLGVQEFGLARRKAEQCRVEQVDVFEHGTCPHVPGIAQQFRVDSCGQQLRLAQHRDRLDPIADISPKRLKIVGTRESTGHADDGDFHAGQAMSRRSVLHCVPPPRDAAVRRCARCCRSRSCPDLRRSDWTPAPRPTDVGISCSIIDRASAAIVG